MNPSPTSIYLLALDYYGFTEDESKSTKGRASQTRAKIRAAAWKVIHDDLNLSYEEIARGFKVDHTSIIVAVRRADPEAVAYIRRAMADPDGYLRVRTQIVSGCPDPFSSLPPTFRSAGVDVHRPVNARDCSDGWLVIAQPPVTRPTRELPAITPRGRGPITSCDTGNEGTGLYRFTGMLTRRDLIGALKEFSR